MWQKYIKIEEYYHAHQTLITLGYAKAQSITGNIQVWYNVVSIDNKTIFGTFDSYDSAVWVAKNRFKECKEYQDEQFEKIILGNQEIVVES